MPKYDYKCEKCGKGTIIEASVHADKPERIRCGCGGDRKRVYMPIEFSMGDKGERNGNGSTEGS